VVNVNNFSDPDMVPNAMSTPRGSRVVMNIIQDNADVLSRMLK
jgi:hypothetical protein